MDAPAEEIAPPVALEIRLQRIAKCDEECAEQVWTPGPLADDGTYAELRGCALIEHGKPCRYSDAVERKENDGCPLKRWPV